MATIASGSHAWKGNWADLVNAASAMSTTTAVVTGVCWLQISSARIALRREGPVATTITTTAASRHSPPPTVTNRVRTAGPRARGPDGATRKKGHSEVNCQVTHSTTTSSANTHPNTDAANLHIEAT